MATFEQLTAEQQSILQAFSDVFRPAMGDTARHFNRLQRIADYFVGAVEPILNSLDAGTVLGSTTSLAGAVPLAKENIAGSMADIQTALAGFYSAENRVRYAAAAGPLNTL